MSLVKSTRILFALSSALRKSGRPLFCCCNYRTLTRPNGLLPSVVHQPNFITYQHERSKSNNSSKKQDVKETTTETEEDEEDSFEDKIADRNSKVMRISVGSLRVDLLLKSGLGVARNKIETLFYESKIRVNGEKLLKKSMLAQEGDEIDIVKGVDPNNSDFLSVARVEVLKVTVKGDGFNVKIRRCKSLTIESYEDKAADS